MPKCPFPIRISSFLPQSRILSTNPANLSTSISLSPNQSMEQPEVIEPPISHQMFKSAPKMGSFTQGDSTLSSTIESHAAKLDFASVENLLTRIRLENRTVREHTFIAIFKAYGKAHLPEKAVDLFHRMVSEFHCKRTVKSFNSVLNVVIKEGLYHRGLEFHDHVVVSSNMNICPNGLSFNLVIKALCKLGFVDRAVEVFRGMPERKLLPDVYTYCTLMDGLCKEERIDEAVLLLDEMQSEGISPSSVTYNVLINGLCKRGDLTRVTKLVDNMFLKGCVPNEVTYNTLIHGLCLKGKLDKAVSLLERMVSSKCVPNDVTYGTLVSGLVKQRRAVDAVRVLVSMEGRGYRLNQHVYSVLISGLFKPSHTKMGDEIPPPAHQLASVSISNDATSSTTVQKARFSDRVRIRSILGRPDGGAGLAGQKVRISGWVKTGREQGKGTFAFLEVNDGSCPANLQVMVDASVSDLSRLIATGTCVTVDGCLKIPPEGKGTKQKVELSVVEVIDVGTVDTATYPIPKTKLTLERLREFPHLRSRTNSISAIARIRHALAIATHTFFDEEGFLYIQTPIITTSDCEGAGEMFQVTTLINHTEKLERDLIENPPPTEADVEAARAIVKARGEAVAQLKAAKASKEEITASVAELNEAKVSLARTEERSRLKPGLPKVDGKIDYSQDFFGRQAFLTVSGQLQVETYACGLSDVYTFGPTFRAENSHTSRHLAEFWMVEPELAFADLEDDMNCAEAYVRYMCKWLLEKRYDDMELMAKNFDKGCIDRLKLVASTPFGRLTYTKAIELLEEAVAKGKKFENPVEWGIDLASEHERYLTEVVFQKPLIVYNYPKGIKAFYMRLNDDGKTVAAMDVLVPKVGELIGGSQREERIDVIMERIEEMGLPVEPYEWYLDLRRYGTAKHSGFGLGFERMVLFATGMDNIRDVIPFPRYPGRADL